MGFFDFAEMCLRGVLRLFDNVRMISPGERQICSVKRLLVLVRIGDHLNSLHTTLERLWIAAQMRACLAGRGGEVSVRNRAAKLAETYQGLDEAGRKEFLRMSLPDVAVDPGMRSPGSGSARPPRH